MRLFNIQVFDDQMAGTAGTWYTSADFNDILGTADFFTIAARVSMVSGTSPTLTVRHEDSCDGSHWRTAPSAVINAAPISNGSVHFGTLGAVYVQLSLVRFSISLGGTSPQCRVKLYVTGRSRGKTSPEATSQMNRRVG